MSGVTIVEMMTTVVLLCVLSIFVAFSARGSSRLDASSPCGPNALMLTQAADAYVAQTSAAELPAIGASDNRYELFLVDAGLIPQVSTQYDLHADRTITATGTPCP